MNIKLTVTYFANQANGIVTFQKIADMARAIDGFVVDTATANRSDIIKATSKLLRSLYPEFEFKITSITKTFVNNVDLRITIAAPSASDEQQDAVVGAIDVLANTAMLYVADPSLDTLDIYTPAFATDAINRLKQFPDTIDFANTTLADLNEKGYFVDWVFSVVHIHAGGGPNDPFRVKRTYVLNEQ